MLPDRPGFGPMADDLVAAGRQRSPLHIVICLKLMPHHLTHIETKTSEVPSPTQRPCKCMSLDEERRGEERKFI